MTNTLRWKRVTKRKKPKPDTLWEVAEARFSSHFLCIDDTGQWQLWISLWDQEDMNRGWSRTHPTLEDAKAQAQHIEDELAKIWTPGAIAGQISTMLENIATNHDVDITPTDYDKALGRKSWIDHMRAVAKEAPGNVVNLNAVKNEVLMQSTHDIRDLMQEAVRLGLITADEGNKVLRATDILSDVLEETREIKQEKASHGCYGEVS